jgi:hypothetical protein
MTDQDIITAIGKIIDLYIFDESSDHLVNVAVKKELLRLVELLDKPECTGRYSCMHISCRESEWS